MPVPMIRDLTRLRDEAERLLETYTIHKDSEDENLRRKAHLDLDRFLMQHREEAILLMVDGLTTEIDLMINKTKPVKKVHLLSRIMFALRGNDTPPQERLTKHYEEPVEYELD